MRELVPRARSNYSRRTRTARTVTSLAVARTPSCRRRALHFACATVAPERKARDACTNPTIFARSSSPASIALVGASGKAGSDGRIVLENLLGGGYQGALYVVNPKHRRVLARRSYPSLTAIVKPIELALIVTPTAAVVERARGCGTRRRQGGDHLLGAAAGRRRGAALAEQARRHRGRERHPGARPPFVRRDSNRHRTQCDARQCGRARRPARARRAVGRGVRGDARFRVRRRASASPRWSRWAARSTSVSASLLDALIVDPHTDGILLYAETDRRRATLPVGAARGGADQARRRAARRDGRWSTAPSTRRRRTPSSTRR